MAKYILGVIDRNDFFSQLKQRLYDALKKISRSRYSSFLFCVLVSSAALSSIKNVTMGYIDLLIDLNVYASFEHIMRYIIVDEDKLQ